MFVLAYSVQDSYIFKQLQSELVFSFCAQKFATVICVQDNNACGLPIGNASHDVTHFYGGQTAHVHCQQWLTHIKAGLGISGVGGGHLSWLILLLFQQRRRSAVGLQGVHIPNVLPTERRGEETRSELEKHVEDMKLSLHRLFTAILGGIDFNNGICLQQQSSSENDVSTRKLGGGGGRNVVFNKTIAGRRRTLLLNVKPARMSVRRISLSSSSKALFNNLLVERRESTDEALVVKRPAVFRAISFLIHKV